MSKVKTLIRFEDQKGVGIFRSDDVRYPDVDCADLLYIGCLLTPTPCYSFIQATMKRHTHLGFAQCFPDERFKKFLGGDTKFAWTKEFFDRLLKREFTPDEERFLNMYKKESFDSFNLNGWRKPDDEWLGGNV